jgi:hypothetical protein
VTLVVVITGLAPTLFSSAARADVASLPAPTLAAPFPAQVHPFESIHFTWSAASGAASYTFEASKDSTFPSTSIKQDNIQDTKTSLVIGDFCNGCEQGKYFARVVAVDADGNRGLVSNTTTFGVSYDAPLPAAPNPLSPPDGATLTLPFRIDWSDVPNPQDSGYELQISKNSSFTNIEDPLPGRTASDVKVLSLTPGKKWWRVRSTQGNASPTTAAVTAWSKVRTFTIPSGPAAVQSVWLGAPPCEDPCPGADTLVSGQEINGSIQLTTPAPSGGATVRLRTNNAAAGEFPPSVTIPAGVAFGGFRLTAGDVSSPTQVKLKGTLGTTSDTFLFTVSPTSIKRLDVNTPWTGGVPASAFVTLDGAAPPGGAEVQLSSSSAVAQPPASFTIPEGFFGGSVSFPTSRVASTSSVTISATYRGSTVEAPLTLTPQVAPTSLTLDRTSASFQEGASGTVRIASAQSHDVQIKLSSTDPAYASVPPYMTVPAGVTAGGFFVSTQPPPTPTTVTISARAAGVTKKAALTVSGS